MDMYDYFDDRQHGVGGRTSLTLFGGLVLFEKEKRGGDEAPVNFKLEIIGPYGQ